eukprot:scaffold3921_cov18-Tisochrysis_lutea.AAC.1
MCSGEGGSVQRSLAGCSVLSLTVHRRSLGREPTACMYAELAGHAKIRPQATLRNPCIMRPRHAVAAGVDDRRAELGRGPLPDSMYVKGGGGGAGAAAGRSCFANGGAWADSMCVPSGGAAADRDGDRSMRA